MPKISLLSEDIINKIAAGEVIERPASVVKELIENSLDSGATRITVEIIRSGKELIKISDNGSGMSHDDVKQCIVRHATSKISYAEDLFCIQSLGFRGEALASIAAVSKLNIKTKEQETIEGFEVKVIGGIIQNSSVTGTSDGTIVEVRDLFFNTPARKKFLKSDLVEMKHIIDLVTRYSLANPNISFKLINENRELINSPATNDLRDKVSSLYGSIIAKDLLDVELSDQENKISVKGLFSKPLSARNDKTQQSIFVNGRWVRNEDVSRAVYDAYHSLLFTGKHPIFVLNLDIDPMAIDVNVHPNKMEIKFEQKDLIYNAVFEAVNETLQKNNLIPQTSLKVEEQIRFADRKEMDVKKEKPKYAFEESTQQVFSNNQDSNVPSTTYETTERKVSVSDDISLSYGSKDYDDSKPLSELMGEDENLDLNKSQVEQSQKVDENFIPGSVKFPAMKILGQIHKTFFVAETPGGMLLIDQHVVQERVLYEKYMNEYMNQKVSVQQLLKKELLTFTSAERVLVDSNLENLKKLGFELGHFGENDYWLSTIPTLLGRVQSKDLIYLIVKELSEGKVKELDRIQEEIITRMACRASVKAGDTMTIPQIKKLMAELVDCRLPYTCPHGRAIVVKISAEELEKKFLRHG